VGHAGVLLAVKRCDFRHRSASGHAACTGTLDTWVAMLSGVQDLIRLRLPIGYNPWPAEMFGRIRRNIPSDSDYDGRESRSESCFRLPGWIERQAGGGSPYR
jgi:hypothetical protein